MSRVSVVALAIGCILIGYGLAGSRVHASAGDAQFRQMPGGVNASDHVRLTLAQDEHVNPFVECTVVDAGNGWIGCALRDATMSDQVTWYDLSRVVAIQKAGK